MRIRSLSNYDLKLDTRDYWFRLLHGTQLTTTCGSDLDASGAGADPAGVAVVPAGTPVQKLIKAVLNYGDPIPSAIESDLRPQYAATDTMPWLAETNCTSELIEIERGLSGA